MSIWFWIALVLFIYYITLIFLEQKYPLNVENNNIIDVIITILQYLFLPITLVYMIITNIIDIKIEKDSI